MGRDTRNLITSLFVLAVSLVPVTIVLADYLGPNRTTTAVVWRRLRCEYDGVYDPAGPGYYGCGLTLYYPPGAVRGGQLVEKVISRHLISLNPAAGEPIR